VRSVPWDWRERPGSAAVVRQGETPVGIPPENATPARGPLSDCRAASTASACCASASSQVEHRSWYLSRSKGPPKIIVSNSNGGPWPNERSNPRKTVLTRTSPTSVLATWRSDVWNHRARVIKSAHGIGFLPSRIYVSVTFGSSSAAAPPWRLPAPTSSALIQGKLHRLVQDQSTWAGSLVPVRAFPLSATVAQPTQGRSYPLESGRRRLVRRDFGRLLGEYRQIRYPQIAPSRLI
jgi:hypothetical protein